MTVSLQTPENVINAGLRRIGYKLSIANIFDGGC